MKRQMKKASLKKMMLLITNQPKYITKRLCNMFNKLQTSCQRLFYLYLSLRNLQL